MKKLIATVATATAVAGFAAACGKDTQVIQGCQNSETSSSVIVGCDVFADTTWTADKEYTLNRLIFVQGGATLTIEAGTVIKGNAGSALIVTSAGKVEAIGTAAAPIVFTSAQAEGKRNAQDWGGIALLGKAPINGGVCSGANCTDSVEGIAPGQPHGLYGGTVATHDCGTLNYVRIEYAGFTFGTDNELNGLTVAGCGSDTDLSYIQVHRGADDGIEFFGGSASIDHFIVDGPGDDGLDWDRGWVGGADTFIVHQFAGTSADPRGIEADNLNNAENSLPRSSPSIANGTIVASASAVATQQGILLRRGTHGILDKLVVVGFKGAGFDIRAEGSDFDNKAWPGTIALKNSYLFANTPNVDNSTPGSRELGGIDEEALVAQSGLANAVDTDPVLGDVSGALTGGTPNYSTKVAAGAIPTGAADWTKGWTNFAAN